MFSNFGIIATIFVQEKASKNQSLIFLGSVKFSY